MKNARWFWPAQGPCFAVSLLLTLAWSSHGQVSPTNSLQPVVSIVATDPSASESGNPGTFTLFRDGPTNQELSVSYSIGGTASNGVDYVLLPSSVTIPAGRRSLDIAVTPIDDLLPEATETVVLSLRPCAVATPPPPGCYRVGYPSEATVYILDNDGGSNRPPVVRITAPPNGAVFRAPVNIPILAFAAEPGGEVLAVEFFAGTNSLGLGRRLPSPIARPPTVLSNLFLLVWSNAPAGAFGLTARATDNHGVSAVSDRVNITVLPALVPPTNRPPIVSIVATDPIAIEGTNCWVWPGVTNFPPTWTDWRPTEPGWRFFTNCGPKAALFTVARRGDTNDSLSVAYTVGGTASNGVDYVALPGVVTIPAGQRRALIPIIPIDDGPPDISSTVVLRLQPVTTTPPDYIVGFPRAAAVVILDGGRPRPVTGMLSDRSFNLHDTGPDGAWFRIEYSTDVSNWTPVCSAQVVNGSIDFVDPDAQDQPARFYRAVPEANPPEEY